MILLELLKSTRLSILSIIFSLTVVPLTSCAKQDTLFQLTGKTMGTQYHVSLVAKTKPLYKKLLSSFEVEKLQKNIDTLLDKVNQQMSTYQTKSEISQFNNDMNTEWFKVSQDFLYVVKAAQKVSKESQGAFDITIAPVINLWGFGPEIINKIPTDSQINEKLSHSGFNLLRFRETPPALQKVDPRVKIDLSAIAKGFAVDKISHYLEEQGIKNYLVEIGGEIRSKGLNAQNKKWRIVIENPKLIKNNNQTAPLDIIELSNNALATSGDYRNYFIKDGIRYSHTINPKTGSPIKHRLASVTVVNKSTMMADAYATAIMVLGEIEGKQFAAEKKLSINMIIREDDKYSSWSNIKNTSFNK